MHSMKLLPGTEGPTPTARHPSSPVVQPSRVKTQSTKPVSCGEHGEPATTSRRGTCGGGGGGGGGDRSDGCRGGI